MERSDASKNKIECSETCKNSWEQTKHENLLTSMRSKSYKHLKQVKESKTFDDSRDWESKAFQQTTGIKQNLDRVTKSSTRNCGAPEDQTLKIMTTPPQTMTSSKTLQNVLVDETRETIRKIINSKATGEDGITPGLFKKGGKVGIGEMTKLLNGYVAEKKVPLSWKNASVVLTHTK